jgi:hypothetical protein
MPAPDLAALVWKKDGRGDRTKGKTIKQNDMEKAKALQTRKGRLRVVPPTVSMANLIH